MNNIFTKFEKVVYLEKYHIIKSMKHVYEQKVFYADTDAYGIVWHGSYTRWLEAGRCLWCEEMGYPLTVLDEMDIVLPVVNLNIRYKSSAKFNDDIVIETWLDKFSTVSATFKQIIKSKETGKNFVEATVDIVAVNKQGKLYRKMPDVLNSVFEKALKEE